MQMIPLYKRHHDPEEQNEVRALIRSGQLSQGFYIEYLEEEFAKYVGAPYAVAVNSCTNAIGMCLDFIDEDPSPIKIPAMTFVSVANEVQRRQFKWDLADTMFVGISYALGGTSIWDCAHHVQRMMFSSCKENDTEHNKLPHFMRNDLEELFRKRPPAYLCFSLYPGKPLSGAEGGLIATDDEEFVNWAKTYRQCGRTAYGAEYEVVNRGIKANMTNLQACIGLHTLRKLDENKEKLEKVRKRYNEAFGLENTSDYVYRVNVENYHDIPTIEDATFATTRDKFRHEAEKEGISTSIHFKPIYYFEAYKDIWDPKDFPNTEKEWQTTVSIPFYPDLSSKDQDRVIKLVEQWIN